MAGRASVLSPANEPLFNPAPVRNPTRVNLGPGGGGGVSEFPFQFSWPGLVNYTDISPGIPTLSDLTLTIVYWTWIDSPSTVGFDVLVNGSTVNSISTSADGFDGMSQLIAPGDIVAIEITSIGTAGSRGLWVGVGAEPA